MKLKEAIIVLSLLTILYSTVAVYAVWSQRSTVPVQGGDPPVPSSIFGMVFVGFLILGFCWFYVGLSVWKQKKPKGTN